MSEQVLTLLKLCLLALLYLFFFRVLRAVWVEIRGVKEPAPRTAAPASVGAAPGGHVAVPAAPAAKSSGRRRKAAAAAATHLVVVEPTDQRGRRFPLGAEITVGRAAGCQVTLDDTFASQIHARLFVRDDQVLVEDLGSTNGTTLNGRKVTGATVVSVGDQLTIGSTTMELA